MQRFIPVIGIILGCLSCSCFESSDYPPLPQPQADGTPDIPIWESEWDIGHDPRPDPYDEDGVIDSPVEPDLSDPVEDPPPADGLDTPADETPDVTPEEPAADLAQDEVIEDAEDTGEADGD